MIQTKTLIAKSSYTEMFLIIFLKHIWFYNLDYFFTFYLLPAFHQCALFHVFLKTPFPANNLGTYFMIETKTLIAKSSYTEMFLIIIFSFYNNLDFFYFLLRYVSTFCGKLLFKASLLTLTLYVGFESLVKYVDIDYNYV